jgi:methionyl-tRNA formyltransferase
VIPKPPWRVAIVTRILPVALGFYEGLRAAGHEPVALLSIRDHRFGPSGIGFGLGEVPPELEVLFPARRSSLAPLLRAVEADLAVCMGFPWKVPPDALAAPPLGWLNGHPSLLPRHRGPTPLAWVIRDGDEETGISFHRMDAEFDTGPVLAQRRFDVGEPCEPDEFFGRSTPLLAAAFAEALERLAAGEEGEPQAAGGSYESFFGEEDVDLDLSRPALELHRLVWAWRYAFTPGPRHGALLELDGETVRVLASSLTEVEGARRVDCADAPLWLVQTEPV